MGSSLLLHTPHTMSKGESHRQSHWSVILSLEHSPRAPGVSVALLFSGCLCSWVSPAGLLAWVWPALSCLRTDEGYNSSIQIHPASHIFSSFSLYRGQLHRILENTLVTWEHKSLQKLWSTGQLTSKSAVALLCISIEILYYTGNKKNLGSKPPNSFSSSFC